MTAADDLEAARASLVMINPAPYNAEAPLEALLGEITHRAALRAQQLRGAGPRRRPGDRRSGRCPDADLDDLRAMPAHDRTVTLECAGNGQPGDGAVAHRERRATSPSPPRDGPVLSCTRSWRRSRRTRRGRGPRPRGGPRPVPPPGDPARDRPGQPDLHPLLPIEQATDPASRILIAYEMNGSPRARPWRSVPADRAALVRRRVREVAEAAWTSSPSPTAVSSRRVTTSTSGPTAPTSPSR